MQTTPFEPPRGFRLRAETVAALLACAAAALWIDLGHMHRTEHSDSLVPVLISLQRWTPYYWEQDRFGMLLPLLAMPFRDPLVNLLVQRGLFVFSGLCSFLALSRWVFGPERWQLLGLTGTAAFLALAPFGLNFDYLANQPYGISMALGVPALIVLESPGRRAWRWPLGALLLGLGEWVNSGLFVFLMPLVWTRAVMLALGTGAQARRRALLGAARHSAWIMGSAAVAWAVNRSGLAGTRSTSLNPTPLREWPEGWVQVAKVLWHQLEGHALLWGPLAVAAAGAAALLWPGWRARALSLLPLCAAALLGGVAYFLMVAVHSWVKVNGYDSRYVEPSLPLAVLGLLGVLLVPLSRALGARAFQVACAAAGVGVVGAAQLCFGSPSPGRIRDDLAVVSPLASEVVSMECTHVAGDYWKVWPAVFLANAILHERGEQRTVWGLTGRGWPTWELARATPPGKLRVATAFGDPEAEQWLKTYEFPALVEVARGTQIIVLGAPSAGLTAPRPPE